MKVKKLQWDSDFFNKAIGEITIENNCNKPIFVNNFDLIYLKSKSDFYYEFENFIENFKEIKVIFEKKLTPNFVSENPNITTLSNITFDKHTLYQLAFESGKYSRYKLDNNFDSDDFLKLYKKWVDNSINNTFADNILVYLFESEIVGFVSYKKHNSYAKIGLIAINPNHQGKGIGRQLMQALENELQQIGIIFLQIPTQFSNDMACNFYNSIGYKIIEKQIIKHFWRI